jgi:hypothetical protein
MAEEEDIRWRNTVEDLRTMKLAFAKSSEGDTVNYFMSSSGSSFLRIKRYFESARRFTAIDLAVRISLLIKVIGKWELVSKSANGNLQVLRNLGTIGNWIGSDRIGSKYCHNLPPTRHETDVF